MDYDLTVSCIRILFLFLIPIFLITIITSVLVGALQTATAIKEPVLSYAGRLTAVVIGLYFVLPNTSRALADMLVWVLK